MFLYCSYLSEVYIDFLFGKNQTQNISLLVHFIKNENIFRFLVKSKKGYWGSSLKKSVSLHEYLFHVRIHVSDDESPKGVWKIVYVGTWYQPKNRLLTNGTPLFFIYCPNLFFGILDDLSKFRSTFGMVNFVKTHPIGNMPKVTKLLMAKYERNRQEALVFGYMICHQQYSILIHLLLCFLHLVFFQAVSESSSIQRTSGDDFTTSSLFVAYASQKDSGVYKCNPSNTGSASINVHVLDGKFDFLINFWGR